jgi:hypothetical protein
LFIEHERFSFASINEWKNKNMKNIIYKHFKEVAILLAGALLGVAFTPYGNEISRHFWLVVIAILLLIFIGIGGIEFVCTTWIWLHRKFNNSRKRICIYAPYEIDSDTSSWIDLSLQQLEQTLKIEQIKYCIIKSEKSIEEFPITINPYGGVYPESNISIFQSLENIFDYVKRGGIYINIADIPFYYAYDSSLHRRVDTTPLAGDFSQVRSFLQTLLTRKLHCFVYGLINGPNFNKGITRIISLSPSTKNFFYEEITIDGSKEKFSPFLAIPYGIGFFIFSTLQIKQDNKSMVIDIIHKAKNL